MVPQRLQESPARARTHSACILAKPQKAPSVSLLMLFRWSLSTSKLSSPWNVRPSMSRIRFRLRSLKRRSQRFRASPTHGPTYNHRHAVPRDNPGKPRRTTDVHAHVHADADGPLLTGERGAQSSQKPVPLHPRMSECSHFSPKHP